MNMNYEPDAQTIRDIVGLVYLVFLHRKFVWKEVSDHDPLYKLFYSAGPYKIEKIIKVDKDWFDDSPLSVAFDRFISVDSIEV